MTSHRFIGSYLRPAVTDQDRHDRGLLLANARVMRDELEQIFVDTDHWNRAHPDEDQIDPDPGGTMRQMIDEIDALLLANQPVQ
jgi:hypothetical protein